MFVATPNTHIHLRFQELIALGMVGLRARKLRTVLSALGIAIGIAAMVAVLGISKSSQTELLRRIDRLGTNVLTVESGQGITGESGEIPPTALGMVERIRPVEQVSATATTGATIRKSDLIPAEQTNGLSVVAVDSSLIDTLGGTIASGEFLDSVSENYPVVVLGSVAAGRLGIAEVDPDQTQYVWVDDQWFRVGGIMDEFPLAEDLDRAAMVGFPAADRFIATTDTDTLHVRTSPDVVEAVRDVLPRTVNPADPDQIRISRPADALEARSAAKTTFTSLLLGLGAVALVVGGVGIANVMVISVLERRQEIGLRRANGATKQDIRAQFVFESLLLAGIGGVLGALGGVILTAVYAISRGWDVLVPWYAPVGGALASLLIGLVAGLYPAIRAAHLTPTQALRVP